MKITKILLETLLTYKLSRKIYTVRASTFSRTELLAYRTEPYYIGTPKKSSFCQELFDLPKARFGTVREKVDARTVLYIEEQSGWRPIWLIYMEFHKVSD